jgi:ABC-2 type transport system ATP-binding protein
LIHNPKILFLDEPTIGLDPVVKDIVRKLIKQMNKEYNTTIFLTSHDVSDIEKLCKRVIIINNGEIVLDDSMENLKYHYLNKKLIDIKLVEGAKAEFEEGITVLKNKKNNYELEIDLTKKSMSDVLKGLNPDDILDINISNVPLEDTITTIYKKR